MHGPTTSKFTAWRGYGATPRSLYGAVRSVQCTECVGSLPTVLWDVNSAQPVVARNRCSFRQLAVDTLVPHFSLLC